MGKKRKLVGEEKTLEQKCREKQRFRERQSERQGLVPKLPEGLWS